MKIELGTGLGDHRFGDHVDDFLRKLGKPDKVDRNQEDLPLYIYNSLRCTFWFDEEDRMHWVQCSNPSATLFEKRLLGTSAASAISALEVALGYKAELEDYGSMESYGFAAHELELQVEYGLVAAICFGHLWSPDDEPIFPG